jgi:glycerophosphoryl diester phosphodiesterase
MNTTASIERFKRLGHRPLVLGHRGVRVGAIENTMAAFELARHQGADGVEFDVRLSRDGQPVVVHDADLGRVSSGRDGRVVSELDAQEIDQVDLGAGQGPPRLQAVLDWAEQHSLVVNVELKTQAARTDPIASVVAELLRARPECWKQVLVSSFHPSLLQRFAQALPEVPTAWLFTAAHVRWARCARDLGARAVHPDARCLLSDGAHPRPAGMLVNTWTVNDPEAARLLSDRGVDAIITDQPQVILAALVPPLVTTDSLANDASLVWSDD